MKWLGLETLITGVKDIPVVDSRYSLLHMNDGTVKGMGEPTYSWNLFSTPETLGTIVNCNYGVVNKVISMEVLYKNNNNRLG